MPKRSRIHSQYFDFSLPQAGSLKPDTPFGTGPAVFRSMADPNLFNYVECFIGPEIYSNPVQHECVKPPERLVSRNEEEPSHARGHILASGQ